MKVVVNVAWPYANGAIHLGHLAGSLLPADIFSRYNRVIGNEVLMVGGSDQHGTPITVSAEKAGMTPEQYADKFHEINKKAIEDMGIQYTLYNKTHCPTHFEVVQRLFNDLRDKGYVYTKETDQYYCPHCARFLPDRYVEGVCPNCGAEKTRSDQCDACGMTFEPGDLLKPYCTLCNGTPEIRKTEHFFLKLSAFREPLLKYLEGKEGWRANVKAFTRNWLEDGLHDRAITRDMSWGVPIPVEGWDDKVIYVWFEAVIGYLSASVEYSRMIGICTDGFTPALYRFAPLSTRRHTRCGYRIAKIRAMFPPSENPSRSALSIPCSSRKARRSSANCRIVKGFSPLGDFPCPLVSRAITRYRSEK